VKKEPQERELSRLGTQRNRAPKGTGADMTSKSEKESRLSCIGMAKESDVLRRPSRSALKISKKDRAFSHP
jgi:hypothetical protein